MASERRTKLKVRGLGTAVISIGRMKIRPESDRLFCLALLLAHRAGERVARAELLHAIWPDAEEAGGRHSLRQALYRLHQAGLKTDDEGDTIRVDRADVDSDLARVLDPEWPATATATMVESAAQVLVDAAPTQPALTELVQNIRDQVAAQYRRAVLRWMAASKREGRWRDLDHWTLMLLQADPLNEEATLARAEAAAMAGNKSDALGILDAYIDELGDQARTIGLPARVLRKRISEIEDTSRRRLMLTNLPFVGRHALLGRVQDEIAEGTAGSPTVLWLLGPAGIGKSRFLGEIRRIEHMGPRAVALVDVRPTWNDRPWAVITGLLETLLTLPGALGIAPESMQLLRQLRQTTSSDKLLTADEMRSRAEDIYRAWLELVDALLEESRLVLLVDDAQWADAVSLQSLARTLEARPKARLALVLAARQLPREPDGTRMALTLSPQERVAPLSTEEMREYAETAGMAAENQFEYMSRRLGEASGGNPLFLSHLIHQARKGQALESLPPDLASLIDGQLEGLSPKALRLLQACSLLGRHSTLPRIERMLECTSRELVDSFDELDALLLLPADPGAPLSPHDAWAERVRTQLRPSARRALALSAARIVEADADADNVVELHWHAARLYRMSGERTQAYRVMMRCGEYQVGAGAALTAEQAFTEAQEDAQTPQQRYDALVGLLACQCTLHRYSSAARSFGSLCEVAGPARRTLSDQCVVYGTEAVLFASLTSGSLDAVDALLGRPSLSDTDRASALQLGLAYSDNFYDRSALDRFADTVTELALPTDTSAVQRLLLIEATLRGHFGRAQTAALRLVELARGQAEIAHLISDLRHASVPFRRAGDFEVARALLEESLELSSKVGDQVNQFRCCDALCGMYLDANQPELALREAERASSYWQESFGEITRQSLQLDWARSLIALDRWQDAADHAPVVSKPDEPGRPAKHDLQCMAVQLRLAIHARSTEQASLLTSQIEDFSEAALRFSGSDLLAVALAESYATQSGEKAARFVRSYLKEMRSEQFAVPKALLRHLD